MPGGRASPAERESEDASAPLFGASGGAGGLREKPVASSWLQAFVLAPIVARSKFTVRQFLFPILVNVDGHRLGHQIAI
jgi:hypothetical protein